MLLEMHWIFLTPLFYIFTSVGVHAFTVDIVNVTQCSCSNDEKGDLFWDIGSEETIDQLFSGVFHIPDKLREGTYVEYESHYWDEHEEDWIFLFRGIRSLCNSVLNSLPYNKFRTSVEPNWPEHCPISAGKYKLEDYPISGQYAVLSDIRDVPPLVRHELKLWTDDLIFCRVVHTISSN